MQWALETWSYLLLGELSWREETQISQEGRILYTLAYPDNSNIQAVNA